MKQELLDGFERMYNSTGEMIPVKLLKSNVQPLVKELEDEGKVVTLSNPLGIGDAFAGLVGNSYPKDFENLMKLRQLVRSGTSPEEARASVECITL